MSEIFIFLLALVIIGITTVGGFMLGIKLGTWAADRMYDDENK